MDGDKKQELLNKRLENYSRNKNKDIQSCIEQFQKKIREGPYYICSVCNRSLYKKSVMKVNTNKYPQSWTKMLRKFRDFPAYKCSNIYC